MFTFERESKKQKPIFFVDDKPVFTQFKKQEERRIPPFKDGGKYLSSDEFREEYNLTRREAKVLKASIESNIVPEGGLKTRFYMIRKELNQRLYNEIDLRGTEHEITWRFPEDTKEWPGSTLVIGSSNSGKTYWVSANIEEALGRKKKRKFIYLSPEFSVDKTLQKLRNSKRWANHFKGIDVSDDALEESDKGNPDDWWNQEILPKLKNAEEGTCIVMDDNKDSEVYIHSRNFMTRYLRTGRHKKIGVVSIQHQVRGGQDTSQAYSSVKTVVLFPRAGGKSKQVDFLHEVAGVSRKKAHKLVEIFGESGRWMAINNWSPICLYGPKFAIWV